MGMSRKRLIVVVMGLAFCLGCGTYGANTIVSYYYYFYGPEDTLEGLDMSVIAPENRALAELERAMALLELGRYGDSLDALKRADSLLEADAAAPATSVSRRGLLPWRPEYHERVMMATTRIADELAMQDLEGAATAADRAMATMVEVDCGACRFNFTRVLSAIAYEGAGRFDDGLDVLSEMVVIGRAEEIVDDLRTRLNRGIAGAQPEGMAPPPVESERSLVVVLLLGRGPYKDDDRLAVTESETIWWSHYLPRDPQAVIWASAEVEDPAISVELTDVEDLAVASLRLRAERVIADGGAGIGPKSGDLRHWASLPASLQIMTLDIPLLLENIDLVYYSPDGYEVDRETIELPESWTGGRSFVIRRMP